MFSQSFSSRKNLLRGDQKGNTKLNREVAKKVKELNIPNQAGGLSLDWAAKIEASLTTKSKTNQIIDTYQVMILDKEGVIREPLYLNNNHEFTKYIYIAYNKNHFSVITSMRVLKNGFLLRSL